MQFFLKDKINITFFLLVITLGLTACGGEGKKTLSSDDDRPMFSWAKVGVSNNYSPSGNITNLSPSFTWAIVNGAEEYQLGHEDVNSSMRWHDYVLKQNQIECTQSTCSYTPKDITFAIGDHKVWWVRAKVTGAWHQWSNAYVFKVVDTTVPPNTNLEPLAPKGQIQEKSPTFKWTPGNGSTDYQVGYENKNGTSWRQIELSANQAACQASSCSYTFNNTNFQQGQKLTWWVRAKVNNGWGEWSIGADFSIKDTVTPPADQSFKIKVDTSKAQLTISPSTQFIVGTSGAGYDYSIDCNDDGVFEATRVSGNHTCTYPVAGIYTLSIKGRFPQIYYDAPASGIPTYKTDARKIVEIVQWGNQKWRSMKNAFAGSENMIITASDKPDLSQVTNMYRMFWLSSKFNHDIGDWDVSHVSNMSDMFGFAKSFNQDITGWDVSNVTDMAYMFDEAEVFNQDISVWNMSKVTNTSEMFWGAKSFNQNIGVWDLSKVENMYNMFYKAESFNQDVSAWDVTSVKPSVTRYYGMEGLFRGANLSSTNYDKLLISWSQQNVQQKIILSAPTVKYSVAARAARNKLITVYGWTIEDAGQL